MLINTDLIAFHNLRVSTSMSLGAEEDSRYRKGFADCAVSENDRVLEHRDRDILLAFAMLGNPQVDRPARPADLTSVEFRLQQAGLLEGEL